MKDDIWWAVVLPNGSVVGQLYVTKKSAQWTWGKLSPKAKYVKVKLVPIKA